MYDIAIIGGGTAGLTAAIYGQRAGKTTILFERMNYGGQIVNSPKVENYPGLPGISGSEFTMQLYEQAAALGCEFKQEEVLGIENLSSISKCAEDAETGQIPADGDVRKTTGKTVSAAGPVLEVRTAAQTYECRSVILACGMEHRHLQVPGEDRLKGSGVSYCATCDGMFFRGRDVAVVGGGNTALQDAEFLSNYCKKVYLIHRRDTFRGEESLAKRLAGKENVEFVLDTIVEEVLGGHMVEGLRLYNKKTKTRSELTVSGVFAAVGQVPKNEPFVSFVETDESGFIVAGEDTKTSVPGVFAAGDCRTKAVRQLTTAAGDGTVAALAAVQYISETWV